MKKSIIVIFMICSSLIMLTAGVSAESLFRDDFNDNTKDYGKWTEIHTSGTWDETNQRAEFQLYESGGGERREGIASAEFIVALSSSEGIIITWDMITDIAHSGGQWVGTVRLEVTDGTSWIHAYYERGRNETGYKDSNDGLHTVLNSSKGDGSWDNEIQIFGDRYKVRMDSDNSGWIHDGLFSSNATLRVRIYIQLGGDYPSMYWRAGFDNIAVSEISGEEGLVGYWDFDETSGYIAYDHSGNGNNGAVHGAATVPHGICGNALKFDGGDDYVDMGDDPDFDITGDISIACWFKTDTPQLGVLVNKFDQYGPDQGYILLMGDAYWGSAGSLTFKLYKDGYTTTGGDAFTTSSSFADGEWHFVTAIYTPDGSSRPRIYVDAVLQSGTYKGGALSSIGAANYPFLIGQNSSGSTGSYHNFNGSIDEVRIYNEALSELKIKELYGQKVAELVGYWDFNEGSGNIAYDHSGEDNHGTIYGGATWPTGACGSAVNFDGEDNYVDIGNDTSIKPGLPITISCWIKPRNLDNPQRIFGNDKWKWEEAYYGVCFSFNSTVSEGLLSTGYGDGGTGSGARRGKTGTTALEPNHWYHVACVIREPSDMDIYVNGVNDGGTYSRSGGALTYSDSPGYIGQNGYNGWYFDGVIDEVYIYNGALSGEKIQELRDQCVPNQPPVADAGGPYSGVAGELIQFDASGSYDPDGTTIAGYRWDWTNDGFWNTDWLSSPTITNSYSSAGSYVVKLQVRDDDGAWSEDISQVVAGSTPGTELFYSTEDAQVYMDSPNTNYGASTSMQVKNEGIAFAWECDALLRFDLTSIPLTTVIDLASLHLYYHDYAGTNPAGRSLTCKKIMDSWKEETVTWNSRPAVDPEVVAEAVVPSQFGWMEWDVTDAVRDIVNGHANYGWSINDDRGWIYPSIPTTRFHSKEYEGYIPYLEVVSTGVLNELPVADHGGPYTGIVGQTVHFNASNSRDPDGEIVLYEWKFREGRDWFEGDPFETFVYTSLGIHTVSLRVTDNSGARIVSTTEVTVFPDVSRGLVAYWSFDDGTAEDEWGNHHGELHGPPISEICVWENGLRFDGRHDYVGIEGDPVIRDGPLTVCAWVRPRTVKSPVDHWIIENSLFHLASLSEIESGVRKNYWSFSIGDPGSPQVQPVQDEASEAYWTFLCGTWNGELTENSVRLYVNSEDVASGRGTTANYGRNLFIGGKRISPGYIDYKFAGLIDEVRIYNRVLDESEIRFLYSYPDGNLAPTAVIDDVSPPAVELDPLSGVHEQVFLEGHGSDRDPGGSIEGYRWESDIDGFLSDQRTFSSTTLSEGMHTITFRSIDNEGKLSPPERQNLLVVDGVVFKPPYDGEPIEEIIPEEPEGGTGCAQVQPPSGGVGAWASACCFSRGQGDAGQSVEFYVPYSKWIQVDVDLISHGGADPFMILGIALTETRWRLRHWELDGEEWKLKSPEHIDAIDPWFDRDWLEQALFVAFGFLFAKYSWLPNDLLTLIQGLDVVTDALDWEVALKSMEHENLHVTRRFLAKGGQNKVDFTVQAEVRAFLGATGVAARVGKVRYIAIQGAESGLAGELIVRASCPVDLLITDPVGRTIDKTTTEIPSATYIETDIDSDADLDDQVYIPDALEGEYVISVVPDSTADSTDRFSISISYEGESLDLAEDVEIADIPIEPYTFWTLPIGSLWGFVSDSSGGLFGVNVDIYDSLGTLWKSLVTDDSGYYHVDSIPNGDYSVAVTTPIGYQTDQETKEFTIYHIPVTVDFNLTKLDITPQQRSRAYWAYQLCRALRDRPKDYTKEKFAEFANLLDQHFNNNIINPVEVYVVPEGATQEDSLDILKKLLTFRYFEEGEPFLKRIARGQLVALMLNVVSGKISQTEPITKDSMNVSQAITYCDMLIYDLDCPVGDVPDWFLRGVPNRDELIRYIKASFVAGLINVGVKLPSGSIPPDIDDIAYKYVVGQAPVPDDYSLSQNYPNPFNATTEIKYALPEDCWVKVEIYDILGQRVTSLVKEWQEAGYKSVRWDAGSIASGIYFYQLQAGDFVKTRKMVLIR